MRAFLDIVLIIIHFYQFVLLIAAVLSWLIAFNVVDLRNPAMGQIAMIVRRLTEPCLAPIRRYVPPFGGLDMAFLVLILITVLIERIIIYYIYPNVY